MRPLLLDAFCCQGGASAGYVAAGFDVVGIDKDPQPRYPYEFVLGDALQYIAEQGHRFDAIHASPPCQHYANVTKWRGDAGQHPDLVEETRQLLDATGVPWIIENVPEAPVRRDFLLCGSMFGLPVRRHRAFETSWRHAEPALQCAHKPNDLPFMHKGERAYADAMGCTWMTNLGGRQAIPPAYTRHVGARLLLQVTEEAAA
jgi:DNA (cytosine-5)-methyltransferase 1